MNNNKILVFNFSEPVPFDDSINTIYFSRYSLDKTSTYSTRKIGEYFKNNYGHSNILNYIIHKDDSNIQDSTIFVYENSDVRNFHMYYSTFFEYLNEHLNTSLNEKDYNSLLPKFKGELNQLLKPDLITYSFKDTDFVSIENK